MTHMKKSTAAWTSLLVPALVGASCTARPGPSASADPARPVTLETVAGSTVKRVTLSAKAAERLDVQTGTVGEQAIVPTQMMGGMVVDASAGGGTSGLWVRLALSPPEWERLAKDKPARILPLETRPGLAKDLVARPTGEEPLDSVKSGMLSVFYVLPAGTTGLALGDRVRAAVEFTGGAEAQKVVPYSSVHYDAKGDAWVYVTNAPRTFMRERVTVERVADDLAILSSGPSPGTRVATVGVSLLYGA